MIVYKIDKYIVIANFEDAKIKKGISFECLFI